MYVLVLVIFLVEINQNYFFKMNIFYKNRMNTETYLQIQCIYDTVENTFIKGIKLLMHFEHSEIFL